MQGSCKLLSQKFHLQSSVLLVYDIQVSGWWEQEGERGEGGHLFEFECERERVGAYSRLGTY